MGDRGMGEGAGSARLSGRGVPAHLRTLVRRLVGAALALCLALGADREAGAWDGERLVRAAAAVSQRAEQAARSLRDLLTALPARDLRARLTAVNDHFNRTIEFGEDIAVWAREDYWASPIETLSRGMGDCEDYATAKYFSLVAAGVPVASLRLVYVRAMLPATPSQAARSQAHMVLAYYEGRSEDPLILDNLVPQIRRASERADLTPVFSFNSEGLWQGAGMESAGDPMARLSRWRDVVRKARQEGFE
jgi:predicted transglutaminase-like cysteine proteinase